MENRKGYKTVVAIEGVICEESESSPILCPHAKANGKKEHCAEMCGALLTEEIKTKRWIICQIGNITLGEEIV